MCLFSQQLLWSPLHQTTVSVFSLHKPRFINKCVTNKRVQWNRQWKSILVADKDFYSATSSVTCVFHVWFTARSPFWNKNKQIKPEYGLSIFLTNWTQKHINKSLSCQRGTAVAPLWDCGPCWRNRSLIVYYCYMLWLYLSYSLFVWIEESSQ